MEIVSKVLGKKDIFPDTAPSITKTEITSQGTIFKTNGLDSVPTFISLEIKLKLNGMEMKFAMEKCTIRMAKSMKANFIRDKGMARESITIWMAVYTLENGDITKNKVLDRFSFRIERIFPECGATTIHFGDNTILQRA
jgi:hypothetical protein